MNKLYVSHPVTGTPIKYLIDWEKRMLPVIDIAFPTYNVMMPLITMSANSENKSYGESMCECLVHLYDADTKSILLCDGWKESKGCVEEFLIACNRGLDIYVHENGIIHKLDGIAVERTLLSVVNNIHKNYVKTQQS